MPNNILRILLNQDRGLVGEMKLNLYEIDLLAVPMNLKRWSAFTKLREMFK